MQLNRLRIARWLLIGWGGLLLLTCGFFGFWGAASAGSDSGSPELAAEWRDHLNQFSDPDTAKAADQQVIVIRCRNGEWMFGRSQSSHGVWYRGGGTLVIRDSTGRTHAFFGHVCGAGDLGIALLDPLSLEECYKQLVGPRFAEHPLQ